MSNPEPPTLEGNPYAVRLRGRDPGKSDDTRMAYCELTPAMLEFSRAQDALFPRLEGKSLAELARDPGRAATVVGESGSGLSGLIEAQNGLTGTTIRIEAELLLSPSEDLALRAARLLLQDESVDNWTDRDDKYAPGCYEALKRVENAVEGDVHLAFLGISRLPAEARSGLLGQLRAYCEANRPKAVRIWNFDRPDLNFVSPDTSAFHTANVVQLRLNRFSKAQTQTLVASSSYHADRPTCFDNQDLPALVYKQCGGQPLLSLVVLAHVWDNSPGIALEKLVEDAADLVTQSPPPAVKDWLFRLGQVLRARSRVASILGEVANAKMPQPVSTLSWIRSEEAKLLFAMGWIWPDDHTSSDPKWGIASEIHRRLAKLALRGHSGSGEGQR